MSSTWPKYKLAEIAENLDRQRVPITKSKRKAGEVPYYGASGVVDYVEDYLFDEELLLVSEDGANLLARTYPIAFSISGKSWVNNHAHVLRFSEMTTQKFIEYYLNSISLEPWTSGMAQPKLNQKALNSIPISIPTLAEQKRIVAILDETFEGIDRAIANTEKSLANAHELFESFLDAIFTRKGEGWVVKKLGELFEFKNGINFTKHEKGSEGILTLDVLNMYCDDVTVLLDDLYRVKKQISTDYLLIEGDVLFVRSSVKREGVGWPAVFYSYKEPVTFCGFIIRARAVEVDEYDPALLVHYLRQPETRGRLIELAKQSTFTNINQRVLADFLVLVPPPIEQSRLLGQIEEVAQVKDGLQVRDLQKLNNLSELKKSILKKAFAGELTSRPDQVLAEVSP